MLSNRNIVLILLVTVGFLLALTLGDFLALHDIQQDYVSTEVLSNMDLEIAGSLPYWTSTSGEWAMVTISVFTRFPLLLANAVLLFLLLGKEHTKANR